MPLLIPCGCPKVDLLKVNLLYQIGPKQDVVVGDANIISEFIIEQLPS